MKKIILLLFLMNQVHAFSVISEKMWITGNAYGYITKSVQDNNFSSNQDVVKARTYLLDQYGYQGLENKLSATHTFYAYNGSHPSINQYKFIAKFCDMRNNCVNYEKKFTLDYGQYYGETIYSSLKVFSENIGGEPIYADTEIQSYPSDKDHKQSMLILKPFPYD